ncbi:meprin A subunit beta-like [Alosa alosa]|uniref:meprin A subunit beta-like n=1 Tax=Alosa alosa TaxID=278164 RepID=UPI0020153968|nr:meprin A subunit beta-like [Alosa alosa]
MREGDIKEVRGRSSLLGQQYRWDLPVPFVLDAGLDINAKGVILKAFEQFRLKTCIDFKLWDECEAFHISIEQQSGCWSYVGRELKQQTLSIGIGCDLISTVEHELLHALGFWHEQSRYDRDDHVTIKWENIESEEEHNFKKYFRNTTSTQGTTYDYWSVMHYGQYAFSNGLEPTIITRDADFQDVIGQRQDMSSLDVLELNRLYRCNDSISFLDHCSFDEGVCEMSSAGWERVSRADRGPQSDHTYLGMDSQNSSFFMHANTIVGQGEFSTLQTRRLIPKRNGNIQCLEFFYYNSGNETDQLNIWMTEFDSENDTMRTRRLMGQVTGSPADYWQLHYVPLNATKTFQVEFEARKGTDESSGGFSVDDINLSETECPHQTWQIRNFKQLLNTSAPNTHIYSPTYYTSDGYRYQMFLKLDNPIMSAFIRLVSGDFDNQLQWPLQWRQMTLLALDQTPDIRQRMSKQFSFTTDSANEHAPKCWYNPRLNGTYVETNESGEPLYVNLGYGWSNWMNIESLRRRSFLKGGDLFLLYDIQDISNLLRNQSSPCEVNTSSTTPAATTGGDSACSKMSFSPVVLVVTLILFLSV